MSRRLLVVLVALVLTVAVMPPASSAAPTAAGSVVWSYSTVSSTIREYTVNWVSSAGGAVSGSLHQIPYGRIAAVTFKPGSPAPTDLYDVTLVDSVTNADYFTGVGSDLSASTSLYATFLTGPWQSGKRNVDLVVANAGASKAGSVYFSVVSQ